MIVRNLSIATIFIAFTFSGPLIGSSKQMLNWDKAKAQKSYDALKPYIAKGIEKLPNDLKWESSSGEPFLGSKNAIKGGTFYDHTLVYPLTLRTVGPDSNNSFRSYIGANKWSLTALHPDTDQPIPQLAHSWAVSNDQTTLFFKLNPEVRWSDGMPVTADDYVFTREFMQSEYNLAPWYQNYYTKQIVDVRKYDEYTIAVQGNVPKPALDLHNSLSISPTPRHFHTLDADWLKNANWAIEPTTGPYEIDKKSVKKGKGKFITFVKKNNWWGNELPIYSGRFNVEKIKIKVIRDPNLAFQAFEKGDLDTFALLLPNYWHDKARGPLYEMGFIEKIKIFNDTRQPARGIYFNQSVKPLDEHDVRIGIQHSLNYDLMISTVLRDDYVRLPQHYTGYGDYSNKTVVPRAFDLGLADEAFKRAGFITRDANGILIRDGQRLSFDLTYSTDVHTPRLVVLKEEAKKAGLEINLRLLDGQNAYKNVMERQHEMAWWGWSTGFRPAYWQHYHSDNAGKSQTNNITNTKDSQLDEWIMSYRNATSESIRISLSMKIQERLHQLAVLAPSYMVPYFRGAFWRWIRLPEKPGTKDGGGVFSLFSAGSGGLLWIDPDIKRETVDAQKNDLSFEPVTIIDKRFKN